MIQILEKFWRLHLRNLFHLSELTSHKNSHVSPKELHLNVLIFSRQNNLVIFKHKK